jgi:putative intracellular protease/amidase
MPPLLFIFQGTNMSKKILMIVTSHDRLGDSGRPTGIWAEELATPYRLFQDAGYAVDIASPKGGKPPFDPASLRPAGENPASVEYLINDADAQKQITNSLRLSPLSIDAYDAVFFPGGHGAMWDLPNDPEVCRLVESAYAANKFIAAVCHGAAGLLLARDRNGSPIFAGRRVNAFTDAEEHAAGLAGIVPFALEGRMRELGGNFENAANWQAYAVRDGNLITGQNPASSELVAKLTVEALNEYKA